MKRGPGQVEPTSILLPETDQRNGVDRQNPARHASTSVAAKMSVGPETIDTESRPLQRSDLELIRAIRAGDKFAADELVRRHLARVRNLIFPLVLNQDAADDLTQDVFANALRSLDSFRGTSGFPTWLHRIALNAAYSFLRQADRRKTKPLSAESVTVTAGPDARLMESEERDKVTAALGRLTPQFRAAIVLTVMQGHSAIDAAEIEGCTLGTMYWRIHEARAKLRDELKEWVQ